MNSLSSISQDMSLYTINGARKYLSKAERSRFYEALSILTVPSERTFAEMIFWTGCRPSEALSVTPHQILLEEGTVILRSAKKRGKLKGKHFRPVPLPFPYINRLDTTHDIRDRQYCSETAFVPLWDFSRTTGWRLIAKVMKTAEIYGAQACARGLRHSLGVHGAMSDIPVTKLQSWLGHSSLSSTSVYLNMIGVEDRQLAERIW
ncbi:MAG: site-specific integrase [Sneathiella sp.]